MVLYPHKIGFLYNEFFEFNIVLNYSSEPFFLDHLVLRFNYCLIESWIVLCSKKLYTITHEAPFLQTHYLGGSVIDDNSFSERINFSFCKIWLISVKLWEAASLLKPLNLLRLTNLVIGNLSFTFAVLNLSCFVI